MAGACNSAGPSCWYFLITDLVISCMNMFVVYALLLLLCNRRSYSEYPMAASKECALEKIVTACFCWFLPSPQCPCIQTQPAVPNILVVDMCIS